MAVVSRITTLTVTNSTGSRTLEATAATQDTATGTSVTITVTNTTGGLLEPSNPDTAFDLHVRVDNGTTNIRSFTLDPGLASQNVSFFFTSTGVSGAANRIGTLRMRLYASNTGLGGWTANSDDATDDDMPLATGVTTRNQGWMRGTTTATANVNITGLASAHYSGDMSYHDTIYARMTAATAYQTSDTVTFSLGGYKTQADSSTNGVYDYTWSQGVMNDFPDARTVISPTISAYSNAALTGQAWTSISLTVSDIAVDPRVSFDSLSFGETLYNRGEASTTDVQVLNARSEALTESLSFRLRNSSGTTMTTKADTGPNYDINYTIGATDTATLDAVGDQWSLILNQSDIDTNPSANVFSVSRLRLVDLHPQLVGTLDKDDFPTEDANEAYDFVILGDVVNVWVHVENIRSDGTEVNGATCDLTIDDPDGLTTATVELTTGADGWTPRQQVLPSAPAGDWTYTVDVDDGVGNTGSASHTITYITPLTSNLETYLEGPVLCKPGQVIRCYFRAEQDDAAQEPQSLPVFRVEDLSGNTTLVAETSMYNTVDDTQTINGARYWFDVTAPTTAGRYVIWTKAQLNGNGIRRTRDFRVAGDAFNPLGKLYSGPA